MTEGAPLCTHCGMPMQLNTAASNESVTQYICACIPGNVFHVNVHRGDKTRKA